MSVSKPYRCARAGKPTTMKTNNQPSTTSLTRIVTSYHCIPRRCRSRICTAWVTCRAWVLWLLVLVMTGIRILRTNPQITSVLQAQVWLNAPLSFSVTSRIGEHKQLCTFMRFPITAACTFASIIWWPLVLGTLGLAYFVLLWIKQRFRTFQLLGLYQIAGGFFLDQIVRNL